MQSKKSNKAGLFRGRPKVLDRRKGSHIPLNNAERTKLQAKAAAMGLPWSTWARATLLTVANWPDDKQPIRCAPLAARQEELQEELQEESHDG